MANGSYVMIDEIPQVDKESRSAFHPAMEQQVITVNKVGINAILPCQCSILDAANPKFKSFKPEYSFLEQVDLEQTILNQFDLIFIFSDKVGNRPKAEKLKAEESLIDFILNGKVECIEQFVSIDLLQKWVSYARETIFPNSPPKQNRRLKHFF